ncbi:hypothetical protein DRP43_02720 [candidate division TA06 bacterium]|uniref:LysM domain-containing protein n=1 Tax=candidate division TA06 bacterium TaxID=2250710 RepID=A0A660SMA8_UNCT6|nr:MAG: hypothetical protein DRP43_02720 [candidate division TA06 bacterium]
MKGKVTIIILVIFLIAFFSVSLSAAEKKITGKDALSMIENYKTKEAELQTKIAEVEKVVKLLQTEVNELQGKVDEIGTELEQCKIKLAENSKYVVVPGDWLSKLAEYDKVYGHGNYRRWPEIYRANKDLIKNPDLILPGWELNIPRP